MKIDFYFSVRSPYSYLISPRIIMLRDEYGVDVNFKLVYPLAIREPEFFEGKNFFTYFWWKMIDMKLKARRLNLPFSLPPKPDPIRQNTFTGEVLKDQPYIFDICHFLQAIEHDKQLDFAYEISRCIFGGTKDWHKEENLIEVTNKLGIDFQSIKKKVTEKEEEIISQIKKNQKEQLEAGHHGVPLSVYKDKFFFGQDKFNDLVNELKKDGLNIN